MRKFVGPLLSVFVMITLFIGVFLVGTKTNFFNKAFGVPANLVVDIGASFTNPATCWKNFAQGGESKGRMLASVVSQVKNLQPQYIRIDHIYDNYDVVSKDPKGTIVFNWQGLDQTVDDILATGAKPFLSLSYMPQAISKDGRIESEPANWQDWQYVIQKTVEHYSGRHSKNIPDVYYEVWNEPDLYGGFKAAGGKSYLTLYSYAQAGANNAKDVNAFKIGGPASTGLYKNWFDLFLKSAEERKLRLDFFSWHTYSSDADDYAKNISDAKSWLAGYTFYKNTELVISEMGVDSEVNPAYDNKVAAIHSMVSVAALDDKVNKCFSFEIIDGPGPQKYWGRWGLFTNEKYGAPEAKPRYNAFLFLNRLTGDKMNVSGQGSWVKSLARYDGTKIKILIADFDLSGKHGEVVPIKLINLPFKSFTWTRINFLGGTSSKVVNIDSNTWSTKEGFDPNSASIFEITPTK